MPVCRVFSVFEGLMFRLQATKDDSDKWWAGKFLEVETLEKKPAETRRSKDDLPI